MTFVIGDIHGEITKLKQLISLILKIDKKPKLIFIGDYIDKGDDAKKTLEFLSVLQQQYSCFFIMGNHEYQWINFNSLDKTEAIIYLSKYGGLLTAKSFGFDEVSLDVRNKMMADYSNLFDSLIPFWTNEDYFVCHSGVRPSDLDKKAEDIEKVNFLFNRYDFIQSKTLYNNKQVIFGHTGFYAPIYDGYKIGLDTGACFLEKQPLTSFCLEEKFFVDSLGIRYDLSTINTNTCPLIIRVRPWRTIS